MDEFYVQGVIGGVLNRHKGRTLDKNRIQTLMVEIAANIDRATQFTDVTKASPEQIRNYNFIMNEMSEGEREHLLNWSNEEQKRKYLEFWTCDICNENTHEVDYDYLGSGTNHLGCELKQEELQEKSDKIIEQLELEFKDYDLSKATSNENSKVDMSAKAKRGKK